MYTAGSLFSGIGGIDIGFAAAGFDIRFQVEVDDYARQILKRHAPGWWPNATQFADVRTVTGRTGKGWRRYSQLPTVDVLFGGFPCQDISVAGARAGMVPGTRSGLWWEFARIIGELRPRIALLENVPGVLSMGGTEVVGSLAALGYDARWGVIAVADAGASHLRERWFCVGYPDQSRLAQRESISRNNGAELAPAERAGKRQGSEKLRATQPGMGRGPDGIPAWLDFPRWPAGAGAVQHEWEPLRTIASRTDPNRTSRIKALGNAVVPQLVYPVAVYMREHLDRIEEHLARFGDQ